MAKRKTIVEPTQPKESRSILDVKVKKELTETQKQIIEAAQNPEVKCLVINGRAGTSKSWTTILSSLMLLNSKAVKQIIYLRSLVQSVDGKTGFLKGDLEEKTHFYNDALQQTLEEFLSTADINHLKESEKLKCYPTSMLRSYNFHNAAVIAEEAQTMTFDSLFTIATRLGPFSKLFVIGDALFQNDLGKLSGFKQFTEIFNDEESAKAGIVYFELDSSHIVRSPFVKFIVEKVEQWQEDNKIKIVS